MHLILSLFCHFFVKSWLGSFFFFLPLQKLAIWLLGYEALDKFLFAEAGIAIEIHPADDRHYIFVVGQAPVLPQERLEVLPIDEAIWPVINLSESSVIVKLFAALNRLFLLFHHPIEGDLLLKEAGKLGFNSWTQIFCIWNQKVRPLCDVSSEHRLITWHENLQEIVEMQRVSSLAVKVLDDSMTVWFIRFVNSILPRWKKLRSNDLENIIEKSVFILNVLACVANYLLSWLTSRTSGCRHWWWLHQ